MYGICGKYNVRTSPFTCFRTAYNIITTPWGMRIGGKKNALEHRTYTPTKRKSWLLHIFFSIKLTLAIFMTLHKSKQEQSV